jgi:hypothetical protein
MKAANQTAPNGRLAQVAELEGLRRQAVDDPVAAARLSTLLNRDRLVCRWERGDRDNVVALPTTKRRHGAGTRHQQLADQIKRATCPEERRQFELRRDQLEREEERKPKKKVAA